MAAREAYVTLCTNEAYVDGATVLGHSLKLSGTAKEIVCLTSKNMPQHVRDKLAVSFDALIDVELIDTADKAALALLGRPELGVTATKISCWTLVQYSKCVFLDADTLVLDNIDELFERPELAAAPDVGWPDCFNSGVFVYVPSIITFNGLVSTLSMEGSFDGGDQGLLNQYFSSWASSSAAHRLPFGYNMTANSSYGYAPAYEKFKDSVKIVHFIGSAKPWHGMNVGQNRSLGQSARYSELMQRWWDVKDALDTAKSEQKYAMLPSETGMLDMSEQALESLGAPPPQSPAQVPTSAAWSSGGDSGSSDHAYGSHVEPAPLAPGEVFNPTVSYAFDEIQRLLDSKINTP